MNRNGGGDRHGSAFKVNGYAPGVILRIVETRMYFSAYLMNAFGKCGVGKSLPWIWLWHCVQSL